MSEVLYFLVVLITTIIFLSPILLKIQKVGFNVYTFFLVAVLVQVFLRNILMLNNIPNYDYVHITLLLGKPWEEFFFAAFVYLVGSILIVLSYIFVYRFYSNNPSHSRVVAINPGYRSVKFWSYILIIISMFSFASFVSMFDLVDAYISSYRGVTNDLENYSAHGGLRAGVGLTSIVAFLSIAYYWDCRKKVFLFLFLLSFLLYLSFAFFTSSRGSILVFFIGYLAMLSFYNKLTYLKFFYIFIFIVFIGVIMTLLRLSHAEGFSLDQLINGFYKAMTYIVVNNGGIDIPKLQHLIEYVQRDDDYRLGGFVSNIILLFIPRSIWPNKPVNIDTEFGHAVYGSQSYGSGAVPPGIFGEFFWDFSWAGIIFSAIFVGVILGFLDKFLRNNYKSIFVKVCYSTSVLWIGLGLMGSGFVSYFIGLLTLIVPLYFVFYMASIFYKKKRVE